MEPLGFEAQKRVAIQLGLTVEDLQSCIAFELAPRVVKLAYPSGMVRILLVDHDDSSKQEPD